MGLLFRRCSPEEDGAAAAVNFKQMHRGVTADVLRYLLPGWDHPIVVSVNKGIQIFYDPIYVNEARTFTRIAVNVSHLDTPSATFRLGLYDSENGYPTNLLLDAGVVTITTAGVKAFIIALPLTPGYYYTVARTNAGGMGLVSPKFQSYTGGPVSPSGSSNNVGADLVARGFGANDTSNQLNNGWTDPAPRGPLFNIANGWGVYLGYDAGFQQ